MAHVLPMAKRVDVVAHLVEGAGIRPTSRLPEVSKPAILSLLLRVGEGCERLHNRLVRDVDCRTVQVDEIWSYVQKKQARVQPGDSPEFGEAYVFVGMASASKLVISYRVGMVSQRLWSASAALRPDVIFDELSNGSYGALDVFR